MNIEFWWLRNEENQLTQFVSHSFNCLGHFQVDSFQSNDSTDILSGSGKILIQLSLDFSLWKFLWKENQEGKTLTKLFLLKTFSRLTLKMDSKDFRKRGTEMVEYICQYLETLEDRRVTPSVEPGYLRNLIPGEAPFKPEPWEQIMEDVETKIMPGVTHWQHPRFHAYFPSGNSFPSILGDMLGDAIGCIGFSWVRLKFQLKNPIFKKM